MTNKPKVRVYKRKRDNRWVVQTVIDDKRRDFVSFSQWRMAIDLALVHSHRMHNASRIPINKQTGAMRIHFGLE